MNCCLDQLCHAVIAWFKDEPTCPLCQHYLNESGFQCSCQHDHHFHLACFINYCQQHQLPPIAEEIIPASSCPACGRLKQKID